MAEVTPDPAGLEMYRTVLGKPNDKEIVGIREYTINHLYGTIWRRKELSLRERRLITIALLACQDFADQLKSHIREAQAAGPEEGRLSQQDLLEVMIQVGHYAGWAAGTRGTEAVIEIFSD
jgi:4-carboxymuconolactone decarboxylase